MRIRIKSIFTGKFRVRNIPCTKAQYEKWRRRYRPIREAIPGLRDEHYEFMVFGATAEEWETHYFLPSTPILYPAVKPRKRKLNARPEPSNPPPPTDHL